MNTPSRLYKSERLLPGIDVNAEPKTTIIPLFAHHTFLIFVHRWSKRESTTRYICSFKITGLFLGLWFDQEKKYNFIEQFLKMCTCHFSLQLVLTCFGNLGQHIGTTFFFYSWWTNDTNSVQVWKMQSLLQFTNRFNSFLSQNLNEQ